jgi:hypothetical protein
MTDRFAALRALPRLNPPPIPAEPATPAAGSRSKKCKPNDPCSCGSHIKFKKCCMHKTVSKPSPMVQMQEMMRKNKSLADAVRQMADKMGLPKHDL